jgi:hypothetical protein
MKEQRPTDTEPASMDERCIFSLMVGPHGRTLVIGIPRDAYERMKDGKTLHFKPHRDGPEVVLFGCADHAAGMRFLEEAAKKQGVELKDERTKDWGIRRDISPGEKKS